MSTFLFSFVNLVLAVSCIWIMKKYMDTFFEEKRRNSLRYVLWISYCGMQFFFKQVTSPLLQPQIILIINIFLVLGLCSAAYYAGWKKRIIFSMLICTFWMLVEIIIGTILGKMGVLGNTAGLAGAVLSELFMFLFAILIGHCTHRKSSRDISLHYAVTILLIPVGSIYLVHNIFLISYKHKEYATFAIISGFILLISNYVIFSIYDWMVQDAEIKERNRLYEQQLELCSRQAEERETFNKEIQKIRHDMKNHLAVLQGMVGKQNIAEAEYYIGSLLDSGSRSIIDVSRSGNIVIDSLVNYKCSLAYREEITFIANIFIPVHLPFNKGDLVIIFGNLLENALDACREINKGERFIELEASYEKEILILTVRNPYSGERHRSAEGRLRTTKTDTINHGLGLTSVEQALEPYHGELQTNDNGHIFWATAVMYGNTEEI